MLFTRPYQLALRMCLLHYLLREQSGLIGLFSRACFTNPPSPTNLPHFTYTPILYFLWLFDSEYPFSNQVSAPPPPPPPRVEPRMEYSILPRTLQGNICFSFLEGILRCGSHVHLIGMEEEIQGVGNRMAIIREGMTSENSLLMECLTFKYFINIV